jgi:uncharacterized protein
MRALISEGAAGHAGWAITPLDYAQFLKEAIDHWISTERYLSFLLEPAMSVARRLEGRHTTSCHFTNLKCSHVMTLYPDGKVGTCDELPMPEGFLGRANVGTFDELAAAMVRSGLYKGFEPLLNKCLMCGYRNVCGGGCLATRLRYHGTPHDDAYCDYRIQLIEHVREVVEGAAVALT